MGVGLPYVCNVGVGDVDEIIADTNSGYAIKNFSVSDYNNAIQKLLTEKLDSEKIRQGAFKYYSLAKGIEKYHLVYQACLA